MDFYDLIAIAEDITYKDWQLKVATLDTDYEDDHMYLQWQFIDDGKIQKGRKWLLSSHMTKSEVVSTALKAAITAEEHEARENFRYKSRRIFGPHFDVDVLAELARKKANLDLRTEPIKVSP